MRVNPVPVAVVMVLSGILLAYLGLREQFGERELEGSRRAASVSSSPGFNAPLPAASSERVPVPSWVGTAFAGEIHLDGAGNVIADGALRALFDYLHSAVGQIDVAQMHAYLRDAGRQRRLATSQLDQLDGLFSRYLAYLQAVSNLKADTTDMDGLRKTAEARYWLRRELLGGAMADGFFGGSEAEEHYTLERMQVLADKNLTAEQRAARLAALSETEPAERRAAMQPSRDLLELRERTAQLQSSGASSAQVQALRTQMVGADAAERLQALDREQAAWASRMRTLEAARQEILADPNIPVEAKQRRVDEIIARDFRGPEALRAKAMLGIAAQAK